MTLRLALDTNAYRALDDGNQTLANHVASAEQLGLPIVVLGELYYGLFLGINRQQNLHNLNRFLAVPRLEILQITDVTAKLFGEIAVQLRRIGRPIQQNDMWIAALCKQHGYVLATADQGFESITGLEILTF